MDNSKTQWRILVTGVGGPAGINIARLLKARSDCTVFGADLDALAAGRPLVDSFHFSPRVTDPAAYQAWLTTFVREQAIDLFIPTVDEELLPLAQFVDTLPCHTVLSPLTTLATAADKLRAYEFVHAVLPALAPTFITLADWQPVWSECETQFLKPRQGRGGRGCRPIERSELAWLQANHPDPSSLIVMEELPGTEWTVDAYVATDGTLVYLVPRERLGLAGGISLKGRTTRHEEVIKATKQLLTELPCKGPVCIQWKQDTAGQPKFVEINPRLSGGLMISVLAGIDPVAAILSESAGEVPAPQTWREETVIGHFEYQKVTN